MGGLKKCRRWPYLSGAGVVDMDSSAFMGSWFGIIVALFLLVLAILWFLLPFIIYSIQKRSYELVALE
jgi:hypothetical protein